MNSSDFNAVLSGQMDRCTEILAGKAIEYATDVDRLHNFKVAAALQGCTPIRALAGMLAKHTVSIYDMCVSEKDYSLDLWVEKITDHMNYLLLLKALVMEEQQSEPI